MLHSGQFEVTAGHRRGLLRARELVYMSEDAADNADVSRAALMTEGSPLMPAVRMAMTNGDLAALLAFRLRSG